MKTAFIRSAVAILVITAAAKLVGASQDLAVLSSSDPVLSFLSNGQMMIAAAFLELFVAAVLTFHNDELFKAALLLWLGTLFIAYRAGLWVVGYTGPCGCLGRAMDWLTTDKDVVDWTLKAIIAYLVLGSGLILLRNYYGTLRNVLGSKGRVSPRKGVDAES